MGSTYNESDRFWWFSGLPLNELRGQPGFKIAHFNFHSLTHKIDQLRIDLPGSGIDIFAISETWLNNHIEPKLTSITGYTFLRSDRQTKLCNGQTKTGGGLGIYCRGSLPVDADLLAEQNASNRILKFQWVIISSPHTKKILIGNAYRPPYR